MEKYFTNLDFPEIAGNFPSSATFWGPRSFEVAIICPEEFIQTFRNLLYIWPVSNLTTVDFNNFQMPEIMTVVFSRKTPEGQTGGHHGIVQASSPKILCLMSQKTCVWCQNFWSLKPLEQLRLQAIMRFIFQRNKKVKLNWNQILWTNPVSNSVSLHYPLFQKISTADFLMSWEPSYCYLVLLVGILNSFWGPAYFQVLLLSKIQYQP